MVVTGFSTGFLTGSKKQVGPARTPNGASGILIHYKS
jgi:hypothetical protein